MNAKKLNQTELEEVRVSFPTEAIAMVFDKGPLMTFVGEDGRLYHGRYEKEIDGLFITGEISKNEIIKSLNAHITMIYTRAIAIAEDQANKEIEKILLELEKLTPPWQA